MAAQRSEDLSWNFSAFKGNGIVSDQQYQDLFQSNSEQDLSKVTRADPMNISAGIKYRNLSFRTMYDEFETSDPVTYVSNKNFYADLQYTWKVNDKLQLVPQVEIL